MYLYVLDYTLLFSSSLLRFRKKEKWEGKTGGNVIARNSRKLEWKRISNVTIDLRFK